MAGGLDLNSRCPPPIWALGDEDGFKIRMSCLKTFENSTFFVTLPSALGWVRVMVW